MWCQSPEDEVFRRCANIHEAWKAAARKRREVVEHEKRIVVHMDLKLSNICARKGSRSATGIVERARVE
jgi:hypothetical protein